MTIYDQKKSNAMFYCFSYTIRSSTKNQTGNYKNACPGCDGYGAFSENKREIT